MAPVTLYKGQTLGTVYNIHQLEKQNVPMAHANEGKQLAIHERIEFICNTFQLQLNLHENQQSVNLLAKYIDLFAFEDGELGLTHLVEHTIDIGNVSTLDFLS